MAVRSFLQVKGTSIKFSSRNDVLNFDSGGAADVNFSVSGSGLSLKLATESVILRGVEELGQLSASNFTFADGSRILIGNNKISTRSDDATNRLVGTAHNDLLIGLGGNDILDGRDGSDTYVVFGNDDGADRYRDSGTTGVDRIVAASNGTVIGLGANFSNTLTGIEAISANGHVGVNVVGSSKADLLNFAGVTLSGVSVINAQAGSDTIIGSNGDDRISGGAGNDSIDGGAGRDTALFAGAQKSYSITIIGGSTVLVKDLDAMTNGNDGTDTLKNVELLQFLDGTVDLTSPPPNSAPAPVSNSAPVAAPVTLAAIEEDSGTRLITSAELLAGVTDVDGPAATITAVTIAIGNGTLTDNGNGSWSYTPALNDDSSVAFNYTATVGTLSASSTASLDITPVNDAPVATPVNLTVIEEDSGARLITSAELLAGVTDIDGPAATITAFSIASGNGTLADNGDGSWSYTPALDDDSAVTFNYTASDGTLSASSTASLDITPVNDAPVATPVTLAAIEEDSGTRLISSAELLAGLTDVDGPAATITALAIAAGNGTLTDNGDGSWSYTPALDDDSAVIFDYTASDRTLSASSTASLDIIPVDDGQVNAAPVAVADIAAAFEDGAPLAIDVLANDTDADAGDTKTVVSVNSDRLQGTVVDIAADGSHVIYSIGNAFQYLGAGETEIELFSYTMADASGAESTADVEVTVTGVNDAPVAVQDFRILSEDSAPVTLDVLLNDTDADASDTKTVFAVDITGLQGSVAIAADGSALIYRVGTAFQALNQGQTATDSFSYTMQDSAGVRSTASVTVTVVGANEAPPPGSIIGTAFDDIINATNADDTIFGLTGDDQISSAGGADTLFGGPGKDTLDGGAGNDVLVGDNDRDELTGGPGADIFRFNFVSDSIVSNPDKIRDFSSAEGDRIDLRLIDANTTSAGDNAFSLSAGLTGVAGQLVFDQTASLVQGDVNGDALADFAISVRLAGAGGLSAGDFLL